MQGCNCFTSGSVFWECLLLPIPTDPLKPIAPWGPIRQSRILQTGFCVPIHPAYCENQHIFARSQPLVFPIALVLSNLGQPHNDGQCRIL
ncbi:MAG: hypothetical protein BJG00_018885 [Limnothrix sp. CACIAM 69d]|nr:MAG: hypothetical protein BJG00_018885 [Limnothrix sp. CACIAM 69d]